VAKDRPLVSQYLERISGSALAEYQKIIRDFVQRRSGVYALYRRDKLYYVGLASNLRSRLKQHLRDKHRNKWDRFSVYLTIGDTHIKEIESLVLRIVHPGGNSQKGKLRNAENLRKRLARELRIYHKRQVDVMLDRMRDLVEDGPDDIRGRKPALARYLARFRQPRRLRATFRAKTLRARVRHNGQIRFKKRNFDSPSRAAHAAAGRRKNGWRFWTFERAPHDWVRLRELRRR
jgi:hypothetical protein